MQLTIGADPEVFLNTGTGETVSAHDLLPGTKTNPHPVDGGSIQVDGTAAEFNIEPSGDEEQFVGNIKKVMENLSGRLKGYCLAFNPVGVYKTEYLNSLPDTAKELGCDPDYNGWSQQLNETPDSTVNYRTAAGHIHIGLPYQTDQPTSRHHFNLCCTLARELDFYLALPFVAQADEDLLQKERLRREMYGKAGAFRPKPYGLEYRALSNHWLSNENLMRFVYRNTCKAVEKVANHEAVQNEYDSGLIQTIVNQGLKDEAMKICNKQNLEVPNAY